MRDPTRKTPHRVLRYAFTGMQIRSQDLIARGSDIAIGTTDNREELYPGKMGELTDNEIKITEGLAGKYYFILLAFHLTPVHIS